MTSILEIIWKIVKPWRGARIKELNSNIAQLNEDFETQRTRYENLADVSRKVFEGNKVWFGTSKTLRPILLVDPPKVEGDGDGVSSATVAALDAEIKSLQDIIGDMQNNWDVNEREVTAASELLLGEQHRFRTQARRLAKIPGEPPCPNLADYPRDTFASEQSSAMLAYPLFPEIRRAWENASNRGHEMECAINTFALQHRESGETEAEKKAFRLKVEQYFKALPSK